MVRLIDADKFEVYSYTRTSLDFDAGVLSVLEKLDAAPTIDAAPVRHGKIIETIENGRMKRVFSCCGTDFTKMTCWMTPNYCPNCGAKMDEKVSE